MAAVPIFTLPALRRARDLIDLCYAEPLNLDDLAREAGYSKYHFARAFVAAYGEATRVHGAQDQGSDISPGAGRPTLRDRGVVSG